MKKVHLILYILLLSSGIALAQTSECEENVDATNDTEVTDNLIQASRNVTIVRKLYDREVLKVTSGEVIELLPGFENEYGATVEAEIMECQPPGSGDPCQADCALIGLRKPSEEQCCFEWLDNENINSSVRWVCPDITTTYTLRVIQTDGSTEEFSYTVEIENVEFTEETYYICEGQSSVELALTESYATYAWAEKVTGDNEPFISTASTFTVSTAGTYGVTVTDFDGCELTGEVEVEAVDNPEIEIFSVATAICSGESLLLSVDQSLVGTVIWYKNDIEIGQGAFLEVSEVGEYYVEVVDRQGCNGSGVITIIEDEKPIVTITKSSETACEGGTVTLTANTGSDIEFITWSTGQYQESIAASAGEYSVTVTNVNGCQGTASITVESSTNTAPEIEIVPSSNTICEGSSVTANVNVLSGTVSSYLWSTDETSSSITITEAGEYSVTAFSGDGCETFASLYITDFDLTVRTDPRYAYITNDNTDVEVSALPENEEYTYSWSHDQSLSNSTISMTELGRHSVTITSSEGCSGTANFEVTKGTDVDVSVCSGSCTQIGIESSPIYRYEWEDLEGENRYNSTITVCPTQSRNYTLKVIDATDFVIEYITYFVTVEYSNFKILPVPAILCSGSSVTLSVDAEYGQYVNWQLEEDGNSTIIATGSPNVVVNTIGNYSAVLSKDECEVKNLVEVISNTDCEKTGQWFSANGFRIEDAESYRIIGASNINKNDEKNSGEFILNDYATMALTIDGEELDLAQYAIDNYQNPDLDVEVFITSSTDICGENFNESIFNQVRDQWQNSTREYIAWLHVCLQEDGSAILYQNEKLGEEEKEEDNDDCPITNEIKKVVKEYVKDKEKSGKGWLLEVFEGGQNRSGRNLKLCTWFAAIVQSQGKKTPLYLKAVGIAGEALVSKDMANNNFVGKNLIPILPIKNPLAIRTFPGGGPYTFARTHRDIIQDRFFQKVVLPSGRNCVGKTDFEFVHRNVRTNTDQVKTLQVLSKICRKETQTLRILAEVKTGYAGNILEGVQDGIRELTSVPASMGIHLRWLWFDEDIWNQYQNRTVNRLIRTGLYGQSFTLTHVPQLQQSGYLMLRSGHRNEVDRLLGSLRDRLYKLSQDLGVDQCDCDF